MAVPFVLPRASPFAFPGTRPGFSPNHPATAGITVFHGFSGISTSVPNGFINLFNGKKNTGGALTGQKILNPIGPAGTFSTTSNLSYTGQTAGVVDASITLGAIFLVSSGSGQQYIFSTSGTNAAWRFGRNASGNLFLVAGGVVQIDSTIPIANTSVPYFTAVSSSASANKTNFLLLNLNNGALITQTTTSASPTATNGLYFVGTAFDNNALVGNLAAVMFSPIYLAMSQLLMWSADPWSFWYPNITPNFLFKTSIVTQVGGSLVYSQQTLSIPLQTTFAGTVSIPT